MAKQPRSVKMQMRRQKALALHKRGYSYSEIGKMLHPQVTKQAVAKMLTKAKASASADE